MRLLRGIGVILCGVGISFGTLAQSSSAVPGPKTCKDFREGLPKQDPMFQLTGKITMKSGLVYEVMQFGRPGIYHNYTINLRDALRGCYFPFYQVSRIDFDAYAQRWRVTLLNGHASDNAGGLSFATDEAIYPLYASPVDKQKLSWLNVVAKTPQFAQPQAIALDPNEIASIEMVNPTVSVTAAAPAIVAGSPVPNVASPGPRLKFVLPSEVVSFPPPSAARTGTLLLFKIDAEGNLGLTHVLDVPETIGKGRVRVEPGKQELIWISDDGKQAAPSWHETVSYSRDNRRFNGDGRFGCIKKLGKWSAETGEKRSVQIDLTMYNPCASVLTLSDNPGLATTANVAATALTFGLAAVFAQHDQKRIDRDKILAVLEKSTPEIEARFEQSAARRYREDFAAAKSIEQINAFITRYESFDADGLVAQMRQRREDVETAKGAANAGLAQFRAAIKLETDTNCGPALEVRGNLVKVYRPVSGFGNEHWIKRDELLPKGMECAFKDGQYVPPRG